MTHVNRHIRNKLLEMLDFSPIVFLNGPRQAGKSTLVQDVAKKEHPAEYVTFDSAMQIAAVANAPESYIRGRKGSLVIDEVQLLPEIFRALKIVVDEQRLQNEQKPKGLFLLTGSANIMALPRLSDALVGRMSALTLYPLSSSEVFGGKGDFITRLFNKDFTADSRGGSISEVISRSTYPELSGLDVEGRNKWLDGYLTAILQRDVRILAEIEKLNVLPNLLRILASRAGGLVNDADIARDAELNSVTARNYKTLLKMMFLTFELPPWYRNIGKRFVKAPKGYMIDTLLLCFLLQYGISDLEKNRPELFGRVLENFVATELLKLITFCDDKVELFHFRTSDNKEVDFVLEKPDGSLAAIEVKNSDSLSAHDLKGIKELQAITGDNFICGIVLYRGRDVVPFGKNIWAVPMSNLWS